MTKLLNANFSNVFISKPHTTDRKRGFYYFIGSSDNNTYRDYVNMKPNDNINMEIVLSKFKTIINFNLMNAEYHIKSEYTILPDGNYVSENLKRDFDKYLGCDFFKVSNVKYHPLNVILLKAYSNVELITSNSIKYADFYNRDYVFRTYYYTDDSTKYYVDNCYIVDINVNKKLKHLMIITASKSDYRYNIAQYITLSDRIYNEHMKKIENTKYDSIPYLKAITF